MVCIEENRDKIKTVLQNLQDAELSSTARLIAILEAVGITDRAEIESLTQSKPSTVREARRTLEIQRQKSSAVDATAGNPAPEIQRTARNPALAPEIQRQKSSALACADITTRANTESSSKILITSEVKEVSEVVVDASASPKAKRKTSDGKTSLPDDWQMPVQWIVDARTRFPVLTASSVAVEVEKFTNHFVSTGTKHKRWELTWRNWLLRNYASGPIRPSAFRGQSVKQAATYRPSVSQIAEAMEELNAEYAL
jgi:hypothetical protein